MPEADDFDASNQVWEDLNPMIWRDAIYSDEAITNCMGKLFLEEVNLFQNFLTELKEQEGVENVAIIEVGMGTAELFSKVYDDYDILVGIDISQTMVDCALQLHQSLRELQGSKVYLQVGNAVELNACIQNDIFNGQHQFWGEKTKRLTCMCMNTFGILPLCIRDMVVNEMFMCSNLGGKVVIGCWHKESLRTGFTDFYTVNPQLCGVCKEEDFDFENGDFACSSSDYTSHWWNEAELTNILIRNSPFRKQDLTIKFMVIGVGIFATCDISPTAQRMQKN